MRHQNTGRKFDRNTSSRRAMFRNLAANLFAHGQIETTVQKAKELRGIAERLITKAKRLGENANKEGLTGVENARRLAVKRDIAKFLPRFGERRVDGETEKLDMVEHLFREVAPQFLTRPGGYTQIFKTRNRRGDNAEMALIRLVGFGKNGPAAEKPTAVRSKAPKTRTPAAAAAG